MIVPSPLALPAKEDKPISFLLESTKAESKLIESLLSLFVLASLPAIDAVLFPFFPINSRISDSSTLAKEDFDEREDLLEPFDDFDGLEPLEL